MKTLIATLVLSLATCAVSLAAFGADKGTIIPRDKLPASMTAKVTKEAKFPGIPSCAKGRKVMTWADVNAIPVKDNGKGSVEDDGKVSGDHVCSDSDKLYVCTAFGKLSIKCENPTK